MLTLAEDSASALAELTGEGVNFDITRWQLWPLDMTVEIWIQP